MRAVVLYHPHSDHAGQVEEFVHDFSRFKGKRLEKISLETVEGDHLARLYGIVRYPAILVIGPEGVAQKIWQAPPMPLMDEVHAYLPSFDRDLAVAQMLSA
jgi:hypothetical protein